MIDEVLNQIYKIELPIPTPLQTINAYFVDERPRTLIDVGIKTKASHEALKKGMKTLGFTLNSIERILITHGHIDHYGQAKRIRTLSGAQIYMHSTEFEKTRSTVHSLRVLKMILVRNGAPEGLVKKAIRYIESSQKMADPLEEAFLLNDKDPIPFRSMTWETIHCPGHTVGSICFYWPEKRVLFAGDHLLKGITPNPTLNILEGSPPFQYRSLKQYLSSLKKIEKLDISLILPGHGKEINNPKALIQRMFIHHRERMNRILSVLSDGEKTSYEIAMELFTSLSPFEVLLGISEALGHLQILKEKGKVKVEERRGKDYYSLEK